MSKYTKGSEWRRWDLHIHTPFTKLSNAFLGDGSDDEIWDRYIDELEKSPVQVFGITDYYSCENYFTLIEKYKSKYPESNKAFFPNVEFRFSEAISLNNDNPNVHIIFDNDDEICSHEQIQKLLSKLKILGTNDNGADIFCSDLNNIRDFESASITIDALKKALEETFGKEKPYLIAFPANNDGIRTTDSESPRKVRASDTMDALADLFFGKSKNTEWFLQEDRYENGDSEPKPVVSGSDAHSFNDLERLEGNTINFEPTWIKADLTFRGLQQIIFEPETRVFIGLEPPVEQRKLEQATKFISHLKIDQKDGYDGDNGQWFKGVEIPINAELTAIIGNKGSGKSALVDIIGLLGESRQEKHFSFLSNVSHNKKFKKKGYAENFIAELEWESSRGASKTLDEKVDTTKPEAVRYLPQSYFEQLTNDIEIEAFRHEIEDVVFSHVDQTDRMEMNKFSELQEFKTQQSMQEISTLKAKLRELNIDIVRLEEEANPMFRKKVEEKLKAKKCELEALDKQKPKDTAKPTEETVEQKKISEQILKISEQIIQVEEAGKRVTADVAAKKNRQQKLLSLQQSISTISSHIVLEKQGLKPICEELGLDVDLIIKSDIKIEAIEKLMLSIKAEIQELEKDNKLQFDNEIMLDTLKSLPDLRATYAHKQGQIVKLKELLDTPQRKYQVYIDKLAKWNTQRVGIIGNERDPEINTIKHLEAQLSYIDEELSNKLSIAQNNRKEISRTIFDSKKQVLTFYSDLKESVETKLSDVRTKGFSVNIESAFVLEQTFSGLFLDLISKNKKGAFYGTSEAQKLLKELLSEVDWNNFDSVYSFIESVLEKLKADEKNPIKEQVSNVKELYDFIFSLGYFSPRYELRLGGKNLNELSPGEKGLLLLVFYLQLDKDNIPLVIDQPEDNLDNESIFTVLANCIREAKKQRQVILVTHNPNLAVGADAEQIIYVQLDKANNYNFSYESGSIENPQMNRRIVDVLEGTQPAFVKRRLKYQIQ